ncbi:MAG: alkaline phosphatase family protein [Bacteroidales bacterium]
MVVVVEENKDYGQIIGNAEAPYLNQLADDGIVLADHHGITHPSQPNYFALFTGHTWVVDNSPVQLTVPNLADQLEKAGLSFSGWAEDGSALRHMPWASVTTTADTAGTLANFPTSPAGFAALPTVSFVTPNDQDNMHDGSIARGDAWLRTHLGAYQQWAETHNSLLVVTFDEGASTPSNHIPTVIAGAGASHLTVDQPTDHYTVLRFIEDLYGLAPLGNAAGAELPDLHGAATPILDWWNG